MKNKKIKNMDITSALISPDELERIPTTPVYS